jgi:tetratricopeptide (TPR) repeat protein
MQTLRTDSVVASAEAAQRARVRPARRRGGLVAAALVVGVAVGRFVTFTGPAPAADVTPAATPTDQLASLEGRTERNPGDVAAWQQLAVAYVRAAIRTGDPSYYDAAGKALDRADALAPGAVETLLGRGVLDLSLHRFDGARTVGEQARADDPYEADALAILVDASVETGRYDEAAGYLQDLLELRPDLAAYSRVSYVRELHGDVEGAMAALRQAETAGAGAAFDVALVVTLEGDLAFNHGDVDGAAEAYARALDLSPDAVLARLGQARVAAARGHLEGAVAQLSELTARYPLPAALTLLADLQTVSGRTEDAARTAALVRDVFALQRASGAVVDFEEAVFEADHGADAVDFAAAAYAERPTVFAADAYAWALRQAGRAAEAVPYVEEAQRLGTADAGIHFHAAAIYADLGDRDGATAELGAAFSINPWFSFLHRGDATQLSAELGVPLPAAWGAA